jgi:hypothetical protein
MTSGAHPKDGGPAQMMNARAGVFVEQLPPRTTIQARPMIQADDPGR